MHQKNFQAAIAAFDKANTEDPNIVSTDGGEQPKELCYSQRMSDMQERYAPEASEAVKLAVRAQHIQRWKIPRTDYPMDRHGYLQWRTRLYKFHAEIASGIMKKVGYGDEIITRVMAMLSKKGLKVNAEAQLLEDIVGLVFIEHYLVGFAAHHPEYHDNKLVRIIRKTWQKMSPRAHAFALAGKVILPKGMASLILMAIEGKDVKE